MFFTDYLNCITAKNQISLETFLKIKNIASNYNIVSFKPSIPFSDVHDFVIRYHQLEDEYIKLRQDSVQDSKRTIVCILESDYRKFRFIKEHADNVFLLFQCSNETTDNPNFEIRVLKKRGQPKTSPDIEYSFDLKSLETYLTTS